jgi:site-specific DNA recombinase
VHKGVAHVGQHQSIVDTELWEAVQQRLVHNLRGHRTRSDAAEPSLLAGLVFDEQGRRLQPTHAKKAARRYRYYVRPAALRDDGGKGTALRIPAPELERAVMDPLDRLPA